MKSNLILQGVVVALLTIGCVPKEERPVVSAGKEIIVDTSISSCPYLIKDIKGQIVLSWIKIVDSVNSALCFATLSDDAKTFGQAFEVPGSSRAHPHGENMPKVILKPSGEIIAVWGEKNPNPKNAYSGLVYYAQSFDNGKRWSKAKSLVSDTSSYDQRYFDVALLPSGEIGIVWLDNRTKGTGEGSGLYYAVTKDRDGFTAEKMISGPCCQCCRTNLFIDRRQNMHVLYRAILNDSIRDMVHIVSEDGGESFTPPTRISADNWVINGCPHTGPSMAENYKGIHFTWFTAGNGTGVFYNHSNDNGKTFSPRDSVSGQLSKHSQIATLPGGDIVIVWNESFPKGNNYNSRIGIEKRDADGSHSIKQYISSEAGNASFPVLKAINENTVIVAYTQSNNNKDHVVFKRVSFE